MNVNYMTIVEPIEIYPTDLERIIEVLESTLWPKNSIDQAIMKSLTNFLREGIVKGHAKRFAEMMQSFTITSGVNEEDGWVDAETNTEVTVSPDFPYPEGTAENNRAAKKAKKRGKK